MDRRLHAIRSDDRLSLSTACPKKTLVTTLTWYFFVVALLAISTSQVPLNVSV